MGTGALDGIRVLEVGTLISGPFAGRLLGDMGAEVIKIEPPGAPDPLRTWGQAELHGHRFFWTVHARNKKAVTLDLRTDAGRELFLELVDCSDIIVENFRPGTLERWNLGYDVLHARNRGIILVRVSGYGQTGPDAHRAGYASVAEASSGLRHLNGFPGGPHRGWHSLGDSLAGMFAAQGALAALYRRTVTGEGQVVDTALTESCLAVQESTIPDYDVGGVVRGPSGTRLEGIAPSNIYRSADGSWVVIAANQDTVFRRLCAAMEQPELATDPQFADHGARGRNQDALDTLIGNWAATRQPGEIIETLSAAGVIAGPINTVAEVVTDRQLQARGMLVEHWDERVDRTVLGPGVVPVLSESPGTVRHSGSSHPGQHNREVYHDLLGRSDDEIEQLRAEGFCDHRAAGVTQAGRLSPKGRQTRDALAQSARKLFAERGFHDTTLADITSAAGKSSAAFYRYFDDKEDLLAVLAASFLSDVVTPSGADVGLPDSPDDTEFFTAAVTGYWNMFKQNVGIMVAVDQLAAGQARFAELQNQFRRFGMDIVRASAHRAHQQGFRSDLDPEHIALAVALLFERFTTVYLRSDITALGVRTTDAEAIRTLATIWRKTLYG